MRTLLAAVTLVASSVSAIALDRDVVPVVDVGAEALPGTENPPVVRLRIGTGGGIMRVEDNFYPNPYVAAGVYGHEVAAKIGEPEASARS